MQELQLLLLLLLVPQGEREMGTGLGRGLTARAGEMQLVGAIRPLLRVRKASARGPKGLGVARREIRIRGLIAAIRSQMHQSSC
jgi:hypothetical protein